MWASIERAQDRGLGFKDMPRIFTLARSAFLRLTRSNVARTEQYELSEWKPQKYYTFNDKDVLYNTEVICNYRKNHSQEVQIKTYNPVQVHALIKNQTYGSVFREMLSNLRYRPDEILNKEYFSLLMSALEKLELSPMVDIVWVRDVDKTTRKINDDGSIQQLFQGRNPNTSSSSYYEGDRSLADEEPDHIQIQIHYVKPTNISTVDYYAPILALYMPEWCAKKLSELVVRQNG